MNKITKKFSESVLTITNQQKLSLTGVEKVFSTSDNKVILSVGGNALKVSGQKLEVEKLDVENGILKLNGLVEELKFDHKKTPILKRLFK